MSKFLKICFSLLFMFSLAWAAPNLEETKAQAEAGDVYGQYNLGLMYFNGYGVKQDYTEAEKWYRKAAEQGFARAQFNLAHIYIYGHGVKQDYDEAIKWISKAAEQGHRGAKLTLEMLDAE